METVEKTFCTAAMNTHSLTYHSVWLTFRVLTAWYLVAVVLEYLLPGIITNYISLDLFLWVVILLGAVNILLWKRSTH